jgi:hypothetical protein
METGLFRVGYEYVEMTQTNHANGSVLIKPKYYEGGGTKDVQNFDVGGMFYLRKNGKSRIQLDTPKYTVIPCTDNRAIEIDIPVVCIACVLKNKFDSPRFADELLVSNIINVLQGKLDGVSLGIKKGTVLVGSSDTDAYKIYTTENQGATFKESELARFAYVSVEFTININADASCLSTCENQY